MDLIRSAADGDTESVLRLVAEGADVNQLNPVTGLTALHAAAMYGHHSVAHILLDSGAVVDRKGGSRCLLTPLWLAAAARHADVISLLLDSGASTETRDEAGFTPLIVASKEGFDGVVEQFLAHGADVGARIANGATALHFVAMQKGRLQIAGLLLRHGADVQTTDDAGFTPLHGAAKYDLSDLVSLLLQHSADPNSPDNDRRTPLHYAAAAGADAAVRLLLAAGANRNARDIEGSRPMDSAKAFGEDATARLLRPPSWISAFFSWLLSLWKQ